MKYHFLKAMYVVDFIEDLESMDEKWDHGNIERWIDHNVVRPSSKKN